MYPVTHKRKCGQQAEGGDSVPLMRPHLDFQHWKNMDLLRVWLFSLEKRGLQGDLIVAFQSLREAYNTAGDGHFIRDRTDRTSGNGFTLKPGRFRLDARKKFFTMKVE